MCHPAALMIASMAVAAYSAVEQSKAAREQGKRNAELAKIAEREALAKGQREEAAVNEAGRRLKGGVVAAALASGVEMSGSPTDVLVADAGITKLEALDARRQAAGEAWGARVARMNYLYESKVKSRAYAMQGFSTVLAGASQLYSTGADVGWWGKNKVGNG